MASRSSPPSRICSICNLKNTPVTAASVPTIAQFKKLTQLNLYTAASVRIPAPLAGLDRLTHLNLHGGTVGDAGVKSLGGLKELVDLHVGGGFATISDETFRTCRQFPKLNSLSIGPSDITDEGLKEVAKLPSLTKLNLNYTKVTDAGMANLKSAAGLKRIDLGFVEAITDKGLAELAQIKTLTELQLAFTKVTRAGYEAFHKALPKCEVYGAPSK